MYFFMLGTHLNKNIGRVLVFLFFMGSFCMQSQEKQESSVSLISYIKTLEDRFDIKFSYLNEDLEGYAIQIPENLNSLSDILQYIQDKFRIIPEKLNNRYYALSKNNRINLCGVVLDNFAENTVIGATVEVMGFNIAIITDSDGSFRLENVSRDASLRIRYLGYDTKYISVEALIHQGECPKILLAPRYEGE